MVAKLIARVDGLPLHLLTGERVWPVPTGLGARVEPKVTSAPSAALEPMLLSGGLGEHQYDAPGQLIGLTPRFFVSGRQACAGGVVEDHHRKGRAHA